MTDQVLQIYKISKFNVKRSTQSFLNNNNRCFYIRTILEIILSLLRNSLFSHFNAQTHVYKLVYVKYKCVFRWCGIEENILSRLNYHECPTSCRFRNIHPAPFLFLSCCLLPKNVPSYLYYYLLRFKNLSHFSLFRFSHLQHFLPGSIHYLT